MNQTIATASDCNGILDAAGRDYLAKAQYGVDYSHWRDAPYFRFAPHSGSADYGLFVTGAISALRGLQYDIPTDAAGAAEFAVEIKPRISEDANARALAQDVSLMAIAQRDNPAQQGLYQAVKAICAAELAKCLHVPHLHPQQQAESLTRSSRTIAESLAAARDTGTPGGDL